MAATLNTLASVAFAAQHAKTRTEVDARRSSGWNGRNPKKDNAAAASARKIR